MIRSIKICPQQADPVRQLLHRGTAWQPGFIDLVILAQRLLNRKRDGNHWLQLQGVADYHRSFCPPNGSCRDLWGCLSSFIDEKPAQRLSAKMRAEAIE